MDIFKFLQTESGRIRVRTPSKIYNIRTKFNFKPKNLILKKRSLPEWIPRYPCLTNSVNKLLIG